MYREREYMSMANNELSNCLLSFVSPNSSEGFAFFGCTDSNITIEHSCSFQLWLYLNLFWC